MATVAEVTTTAAIPYPHRYDGGGYSNCSSGNNSAPPPEPMAIFTAAPMMYGPAAAGYPRAAAAYAARCAHGHCRAPPTPSHVRVRGAARANVGPVGCA